MRLAWSLALSNCCRFSVTSRTSRPSSSASWAGSRANALMGRFAPCANWRTKSTAMAGPVEGGAGPFAAPSGRAPAQIGA
jgi:hypothetical protein